MSAGLIKRACPLCGSTEADPLVRLELGNFDNEAPRTIEAFSCRLCGLVYNQADPEELARYYRDTKRFSSERGWLGGGPELEKLQNRSKADFLDQISQFLPDRGLRAADVGCGNGLLMDNLKSRGYTGIIGIETNLESVERLRRRGLDVRPGKAGQLPLETETMDALFYTQVLEHIYDLAGLLEEARRVLRPGGLICLDVPDASAHDLDPACNCFQWLFPEHINHFDAAHLDRLLTANGFEPLLARRNNRNLDGRPSWTAIAVGRKGRGFPGCGPSGSFELREVLTRLTAANQGFADERRPLLSRLGQSGRPLHLWPLSFSFWYFYGHSDLPQANIISLLDSNELLHGRTIDGRPVRPLSSLAGAGADDLLLVFSRQHEIWLEKYLRAQNLALEILSLV